MSWIQGGVVRRRSYHVGNLRAQLIAEARAILEAEGASGLNLRALAARAGIAPGSVYHHFASKQALLAELAAEGFGELESELRAAVGRQDPRPIRTCATAYFEFARSRPALYGLMFDAAVLSEDEAAAARGRMFACLEAGIAASPSQSERPPETIRQISLAVWTCAHGAASMLLAGSAGSDADLMDEVIAGLEALFRPR